MSRIPAPAVLLLLQGGIQPADLARDLDLTRQAVSFQLAGKSAATSPELLAAIAERGGQQLADSVAELIDQARTELAAT